MKTKKSTEKSNKTCKRKKKVSVERCERLIQNARDMSRLSTERNRIRWYRIMQENVQASSLVHSQNLE